MVGNFRFQGGASAGGAFTIPAQAASLGKKKRRTLNPKPRRGGNLSSSSTAEGCSFRGSLSGPAMTVIFMSGDGEPYHPCRGSRGGGGTCSQACSLG
jgi:hypothetical protein